MAKENVIVKEATVTQVLPDTKYRVVLPNGFEVLAYAAGKVKRNYVKIMKHDQVKLEISPDDPTRGRIVFRYKKPRTHES